MMLPAASARFWRRHLAAMLAIAILMAVISALAGVIVAWHFSLPAGPAVVRSAAMLCFVSILTGPCGGILRRH